MENYQDKSPKAPRADSLNWERTKEFLIKHFTKISINPKKKIYLLEFPAPTTIFVTMLSNPDGELESSQCLAVNKIEKSKTHNSWH